MNAQQRYDRKNPPISFRVSRNYRNKLKSDVNKFKLVKIGILMPIITRYWIVLEESQKRIIIDVYRKKYAK